MTGFFKIKINSSICLIARKIIVTAYMTLFYSCQQADNCMHDLKRIDDQTTTVVSPKITSTFSQEKFNLYMSFICFQLKFRQTFMIYINVFYKKD